MKEFIQYVLGFYGRGGIYDMGATPAQVVDIIDTYLDYSKLEWANGIEFGYDSTDREIIRDYLVADYVLDMP